MSPILCVFILENRLGYRIGLIPSLLKHPDIGSAGKRTHSHPSGSARLEPQQTLSGHFVGLYFPVCKRKTKPTKPGLSTDYSGLVLAYRRPCSSNGKESACEAGDQGSIPGLGSSSGEGNGSPLQYSCLENSMDREAWRATVCGVAKSRTRLSD